MNNFSLFEDTFRMDQRLHQLALYDVTKGMLVLPGDIDEVISLQNQTVKKFNYFKTLIQNNDCTFSYIEQTVLKNNGPYPKEEMKDFNELLEPQNEESKLNDSSNLAKQFMSLLLLGSEKQHESFIRDKGEKEYEETSKKETEGKKRKANIEKPKRKYVRRKKTDINKKGNNEK